MQHDSNADTKEGQPSRRSFDSSRLFPVYRLHMTPRRTTFTFHSAGQLIFGRGAVDQLGEIAKRLVVSRVLIVTDAPLVRAGIVERVETPLQAAQIAVDTFDGGLPEPPL